MSGNYRRCWNLWKSERSQNNAELVLVDVVIGVDQEETAASERQLRSLYEWLLADAACRRQHMSSDRSLSEQTRDWAVYAVDCARDGIHPPSGPPPGSWLSS
jgi:hypothetical protein